MLKNQDVLTVKMAAELSYWMQVPQLVEQRYKEAKPIKDTIRNIIKHLPVADPGYGYVFWHPDKKALYAVLSDSDEQQTYNRWSNALKAISGVQSVQIEAESHPPDQEDWIMIKKAAPLGWLGAPLRLGGKMTGGPSPLSNSIVGGLLSGGLGYGTGWLLEHLFPDRFVRRGRLRNMLGLIGAGAGAVPGVWQGFTAKRQSQAAGKPLGWQSFVTPTKDVPTAQSITDQMHGHAFTSGLGGRWDENEGRIVTSADLSAFEKACGDLPPVDERIARAALGMVKQAIEFGKQNPQFNAGGTGLRSVPMDAFNRAVWNDVRMGMTAGSNPFGTKSPYGDNKQQFHTPPVLGAATSGLLSGFSSMYGGRSVLSPRHFINGLATAGVDTATAHIVGGALGALGGLTPEAQRKIQDIGLWGGLLRGTVGSMLR